MRMFAVICITVVLIVAFVWWAVDQRNDDRERCEMRGGTLVRTGGADHWECLDVRPLP